MNVEQFAAAIHRGGIALSEDTPQLHPSGTELYQWSQFVVTVSQLSARLRQRRALNGRLAHADDEHAARLEEARAAAPVRPMTEDEQREWFGRIPAELRAQREESFTVWTARVAGGWGVEANTWDTATGTPTSTLLVFCRDDEDAIDLCRHLRDHHTPEDLARLNEMAERAVRRPAPMGTPVSPTATSGSRRYSTPLALSEEEWEAALRAHVNPRLADKLIIKDPAHPHHTAWRELHALANEEVWRVGADPAKLAELVRDVPVWRETVRKPPALAHWAITEMRTRPGYEDKVRRQPATAWSGAAAPSSSQADGPLVVEGEVMASIRLRLDQVHGPEEALRWANGLASANPEHRLEAKQGLGRWGSRVDTVLSRKFPGLMETTNAAAKRQRRSEQRGDAAPEPAESVSASAAEPPLDPARTAQLLEEVGQLDPGKSGDRIAAFTMLGHVPPEVNLELARRFGDDERFAQKLAALYPDGLAEIEAAAWRSRADANEQRGAAHMAVPDDPDTPPREDLLARATATGDQQTAAAQRGVAAAVTDKPPVVVPPVEAARRRTR